MLKKRTAFTYVELIISAMMLIIVTAGVFAAFLSSAKLTASYRHDVMASIGAQGALEYARVNNKHDNVDLINNTDADGNPSAWPLNSEVNNLQATYRVDDVNLGCTNTAYNFKRVTAEVVWDERNI
ncbi:MAG: hypothetical protein JW946_00220 [Candidatus Omnitrophica bacterium]|nr:hypothetical protein [Candidatus Omnitrophota bacterium]